MMEVLERQGKPNEIEMNKRLQSVHGRFDFGTDPWVLFTSSCLFVLPMGKIAGFALNILHKLNLTFSFSSNAVSSYCF